MDKLLQQSAFCIQHRTQWTSSYSKVLSVYNIAHNGQAPKAKCFLYTTPHTIPVNILYTTWHTMDKLLQQSAFCIQHRTQWTSSYSKMLSVYNIAHNGQAPTAKIFLYTTSHTDNLLQQSAFCIQHRTQWTISYSKVLSVYNIAHNEQAPTAKCFLLYNIAHNGQAPTAKSFLYTTFIYRNHFTAGDCPLCAVLYT